MIHQRHRQTDGRTDGQTTSDRKTALCTVVHRQGLEVGWAKGVWGQRQSPDWGLGAKQSPRSQTCIYNLQWTSAFSWCSQKIYGVQAHVESATPLPTLYSSKTLRICANLTTLSISCIFSAWHKCRSWLWLSVFFIS